MAMKVQRYGGTRVDPSSGKIKFLGVSLKKSNDNSTGVTRGCALDRVIFHHKKYNEENFGLRVIVFEPGTDQQYVEALVLTPKASEIFYGHTLEDVEYDAIYFLNTLRRKLGMFDMPSLDAVKTMFDQINTVKQDNPHELCKHNLKTKDCRVCSHFLPAKS